MPACATRYAGSPPISCPWKRTEPALGGSAPAIRLKVVLLPEPFGPMRPRISPSATSKETFLTARKPSKSFVSPATLSTFRQLYRGAVREDLRAARHEFRRVVAHGNHGVRAQLLRMRHH